MTFLVSVPPTSVLKTILETKSHSRWKYLNFVHLKLSKGREESRVSPRGPMKTKNLRSGTLKSLLHSSNLTGFFIFWLLFKSLFILVMCIPSFLL